MAGSRPDANVGVTLPPGDGPGTGDVSDDEYRAIADSAGRARALKAGAAAWLAVASRADFAASVQRLYPDVRTVTYHCSGHGGSLDGRMSVDNAHGRDGVRVPWLTVDGVDVEMSRFTVDDFGHADARPNGVLILNVRDAVAEWRNGEPPESGNEPDRVATEVVTRGRDLAHVLPVVPLPDGYTRGDVNFTTDPVTGVESMWAIVFHPDGFVREYETRPNGSGGFRVRDTSRPGWGVDDVDGAPVRDHLVSVAENVAFVHEAAVRSLLANPDYRSALVEAAGGRP